jgi:hypothetical protein
MSMDLTIIEQVQKFSWNFEDIKQYLENHIKQYDNLVVSETNLQEMERTQREIASLRTKISKFKTTVKRELEKPYQEFELQVKDLLKLVESAELPIQEQLEKYEEKRREEMAINVQHWINKTSVELGLDEKYSSQISVADKWLNRTQKKKDTIDDIQQRVCWFLDIQAKDREAETFRQQKIEMAKFMCESLSVGLVTPVTFEEIEYKIESTDIASLKAYIENEVARRREREEKAAQVAVEKVEQGIIVVDISPEPVSVKPDSKKDKDLFNVQFVVYGVTNEEFNLVYKFIKDNNFKFKSAIKPAEKEAV